MNNTSNRLDYFLMLGSNMGDKSANLSEALKFLSRTGEILYVSAVYETDPEGMAPGTAMFYNQAAAFRSPDSPLLLLGKIKEFETSMGRDTLHSHNLSRIIDIDIVLAGETVIQTPILTIPHKEMHRRAFVLVPLCEIAPLAPHPVLGKTITRLLLELPQDTLHRVRKVSFSISLPPG